MKNIICIALLCVGIVARGNTCKWSVIGATEAWSGYKAYLVQAIDSSWKSVADIESAALALAADGTSGDIVATRGGGYGFSKSQSAIGSNITAEKMSSVGIVVVSADSKDVYYYIDNVDLSASVYDESVPGTAPDATILSASDISKEGHFGGPGPDPTPEPTSGLLLLLGAAGLALRRRVK